MANLDLAKTACAHRGSCARAQGMHATRASVGNALETTQAVDNMLSAGAVCTMSSAIQQRGRVLLAAKDLVSRTTSAVAYI